MLKFVTNCEAVTVTVSTQQRVNYIDRRYCAKRKVEKWSFLSDSSACARNTENSGFLSVPFSPSSTSDSLILFPCIFVFLYQNRGIIGFLTLLNHGKAYATKNAIISCPEPVSQL
jgi:hypothetical protein